MNVRSTGFERLKAQGAAAIPPVVKVLADANPFHRARAIWLLAQMGPTGVHEVSDGGRPDASIGSVRSGAAGVEGTVEGEAQARADRRRRFGAKWRVASRDYAFAERRPFAELAAAYDGTDFSLYICSVGTAASAEEAAVYSAMLPTLGHPDSTRWDARFRASRGDASARRLTQSKRARRRQVDRDPQAGRCALGFVNVPGAKSDGRLTRSDAGRRVPSLVVDDLSLTTAAWHIG